MSLSMKIKIMSSWLNLNYPGADTVCMSLEVPMDTDVNDLKQV